MFIMLYAVSVIFLKIICLKRLEDTEKGIDFSGRNFYNYCKGCSILFTKIDKNNIFF